MTSDPNNSAKVSNENGSRIVIQIGGVYTFCQKYRGGLI